MLTEKGTNKESLCFDCGLDFILHVTVLKRAGVSV